MEENIGLSVAFLVYFIDIINKLKQALTRENVPFLPSPW